MSDWKECKLWEALKALDEGMEVERKWFHRSSKWCKFVSENVSLESYRACTFRIRPKLTEAEKFLERWKGKKITSKELRGFGYKWIKINHTCEERGVVGENNNGHEHSFGDDWFNFHWQEWQETTAEEPDLPELPLIMTHDANMFKTISTINQLIDCVEALRGRVQNG